MEIYWVDQSNRWWGDLIFLRTTFCWIYTRSDDQNAEWNHTSAILVRYAFSSVGHRNIYSSHVSCFTQWNNDISVRGKINIYRWSGEKYRQQHGVMNIIILHFLSVKYQCTKGFGFQQNKTLIRVYHYMYLCCSNSMNSSIASPFLLWTNGITQQ